MLQTINQGKKNDVQIDASIERDIKTNDDESVSSTESDDSYSESNNDTPNSPKSSELGSDVKDEGGKGQTGNNNKINKHSTVEMTVALGDFDANPIIPMLTLNHEEVGCNDLASDSDSICGEEDDARTDIVTIRNTDEKTAKERKLIIPDLSKPISNKKRKPLIEEVS